MLDRNDRLQKAQTLIDLKRFDAALEVLAPLLATDDGPALSRGTRALIGLNRSADAVAMANRAVAASPDSEWAHRLRSASLMALAKSTDGPDRQRLALDARDAARTSVRLAPNLSAGYRNAVSAEIAAGDFMAAGAAVHRLIEMAPSDSETWNTACLLALAQDNVALAESNARRSLELDPNSSEAWNNLGVSLQRSGRLKDAVSAYVQSARLDPGESLTRRNIARNGILLLRMLAMIVLLPVIFAPNGLVVFAALTVAGYALFRPDGWRRDQLESWAIAAALRLDRMSIRSARLQVILTQGVTRVVMAAVFLAAAYTAENSPTAVVLPSAAALLAMSLHSYMHHRHR
ncbi:MAG TPA: tetratricopeptide repeat protein [Acidimicrobiales bacterium]|jgi:Flp pilus assembly protein TadD|nr:tetratricopeptide repeat protein [Acidimicrobiales bacterium]